ncbi:hypothetical protein F4820DRAFT_401941 [Hypoxylon rubiginosum]|uniref:Uncharacterized protein n=1 Tax=Hypoxylon rubiginosum TaxID=110542 RepID=A0ACB9ZGC5_9PEZI|nr:hypothetical protein F4820DRAFT_401941 [Hypoxylon rubiginosum]
MPPAMRPLTMYEDDLDSAILELQEEADAQKRKETAEAVPDAGAAGMPPLPRPLMPGDLIAEQVTANAEGYTSNPPPEFRYTAWDPAHFAVQCARVAAYFEEQGTPLDPPLNPSTDPIPNPNPVPQPGQGAGPPPVTSPPKPSPPKASAPPKPSAPSQKGTGPPSTSNPPSFPTSNPPAFPASNPPAFPASNPPAFPASNPPSFPTSNASNPNIKGTGFIPSDSLEGNDPFSNPKFGNLFGNSGPGNDKPKLNFGLHNPKPGSLFGKDNSTE